MDKKPYEMLIEQETDLLEKDQNFEITTKYLVYRQEVIAQSLGGQNVY